MKNKMIGYHIEQFSSADEGRGGCGLSITLSKEITEAYLLTKRPKDQRVTKMMLKMFEQTLGTSNLSFAKNISFYKDTWLLTGLIVGNDCACFTMGSTSRLEESLIKDIKYTPHNIDSSAQASTLLAMWLIWFNYTIGETSYSTPFAIG